LSNVRERLHVLYGDDFRLDIESHEGQGTIIRIDVPELVPVIPEVSVFSREAPKERRKKGLTGSCPYSIFCLY